MLKDEKPIKTFISPVESSVKRSKKCVSPVDNISFQMQNSFNPLKIHVYVIKGSATRIESNASPLEDFANRLNASVRRVQDYKNTLDTSARQVECCMRGARCGVVECFSSKLTSIRVFLHVAHLRITMCVCRYFGKVGAIEGSLLCFVRMRSMDKGYFRKAGGIFL